MTPRTLISCLLLLSAVTRGAAQEVYSSMEFVENKGQWDKRVDFRGEMPAGAFFIQRQGFTVLLHNPDDLQRSNHGGAAGADISIIRGRTAAGASGAMVRSHAYRVSFIGANDQIRAIPDLPLPTYNNYFIGNDPSRWATHCQVYGGITYKDIYPNVDLRYYSDNGQLKYEFIVHPGGNVDQIAMKYEGMDKLSTKKNELLVSTSAGQVKELSPYSYQLDDSGRVNVRCRYVIQNGNTLKFRIDSYSPGATLIIDPTLVFCSFTGSKISNWGFTATPGPDGSFFAGGIVFGNGFPQTTGALETNYRGGEFDVGIMRFSSNGTNKLYSTYLGGNDSETPHSMVCDLLGNLVVLGRTYSSDFPFKTFAGSATGGADMFIAKLNSSGTALIGCLRVGGSGNDCVNIEDQLRNNNEHAETLIRNYGDDSRSEVILDGASNIFVAASTQSSKDFPIVGNVFQPVFGGGTQDGVVLKIDPNCDSLIWSSFLGGKGEDASFVIKPDPVTGDLYVAGATTSIDFPGNMSHVIQNGYQGGTCDGFITRISADGRTQKSSSYLGTGSADAIYGVQIDRLGFPYVMGTTNGTWPVINAGYVDAGAKQFVAKLQPDLSGFIYSTTFGKSSPMPNISPVAFLVDRCQNVYVSGWGGWIFQRSDPYGLSGTLGMRTTRDAIKISTDNRDFYFIVLKKDVTDILYGTFYGQDDNANSISEHVDGGTSRYDQNGIIYQAICANCNGKATRPFPTTAGAWATTNGTGSNGCNLAALKIAFNFAGVSAGLKASVNGRDNDTSGCVSLDALLQDTVRNAKSYIWSFGDGSPDTSTKSYSVNHTYPNTGVYTVRLIAIDSSSCNLSDTTYRHLIARNDKAPLDFSYAKPPGAPCTSMDYIFTNLSTAPPGKPFGNASFVWNFGDGTGPGAPVGLVNVPHTFANAGTYKVSLILVDTNYCNYPDTDTKVLRISPLVKAQFETPAAGCAPYTAEFNNTSLAGLQFFWNFGDGSPISNDPSPEHVYPNTGTYTIHLTVVDTTTCNKIDSTQRTITVSAKPTSGFTFGPDPPAANTPIVFYNASSGGVKYQWLFGDGTSEFKTTEDTARHLYNRTDTFQACLVVFNQYGCTDTLCHPVPTLINPLLDVPNAFTPGRFGENGVIRVIGFGITHMIFRIYNRWGEVVFQSGDPSQGWDGTFKGALQPMDVYSYTLEADFSNGTHVHKKGDITLIR
ncbi:MAG: PKD domain-containing protein [Bacteroidota bacterium]|nr:PKD domain-containing protein [Bacteroidota bacterium]